MTRDELLRILSFAEAAHDIAEKRAPLTETDPRWNIISYAMRRHLEGKMVTKTSAAMASGVPYGTALRRVSDLIDEGLLRLRPRSRSGKSYSLHPTRRLIEEFESYAMQMKALVGGTFGFNTGDGEIGDFYFGGYYMASRILAYPSPMRQGIGYDRPFRILGPEDPMFRTLKANASSLKELCGGTVEIELMPLDALHEEIMENARRPTSRHDLVAFDLPWIGQLAEEHIIEPLDETVAAARYSAADFHNAALRGSCWAGRLYGLPIQPTVELLFCRADLFAEAGLALPTTTDDVLFAARVLDRFSLNSAGIVMNYGRGTPVAHTYLQTLADFGQPVINLTPVGDDFDLSSIEGDRLRPRLDTDAARCAAEFLLELADFAHPASLTCDWDKRIALFSGGHAAMTYGWSIRAAAFELNRDAAAHGHVSFVPHPPAPGCATVSPIGGFSLAMPTGLGPERMRASWKTMEYLTRPELLKWYVQNGNLTSARFSASADPEVKAKSQLIAEVDAMERRGQVRNWPRPPIPEFSDILGILGDEIHIMLRRDRSVGAALAASQQRIDQLMRANGRY